MENKKVYYAKRSKDNRLQTLEEHSAEVGSLAAKYANKFGCEDTGRLLGHIHDIGKTSDMFQKRLHGGTQKINHAMAGDVVLQILKAASLAPLVGGHHTSLSNDIYNLSELGAPVYNGGDGAIPSINSSAGVSEGVGGCLFFLKQHGLLSKEELEAAKDEYERFVSGLDPSNLVRMLRQRAVFSTLIDADYTASAEFENPGYIQETERHKLDAEKYLRKLEKHRETLKQESYSSGEMNKLREEVYADCMSAAERFPEDYLFSLTAPTGTGKTLGMMVFALTEALKHGRERIIIALPYLSITDQTARTFREIFGNDVVFESDSNTEYSELNKELAERWTVPIIITTTKTLLETLFRCRAPELRKLHNMANSVICFDEVQSLPAELIKSTLSAVKCLSEDFNTTVLFSSATMPSYNRVIDWKPREVISDVDELYRKYAEARRIDVKYEMEPKSADALVSELRDEKSFMVIFNLKRHVEEAYKKFIESGVPKDDLYSITALLSKPHREEILKEIKGKLKRGLPVKIVATQCVEAGVDLDIPVVYRALAPAHALVQAAGRTARNGTYRGKFVVFKPDDDSGKCEYPSPLYEKQVKVLGTMLREKDFDINGIADITEYYNRLYTYKGFSQDTAALREAIENLDFQAVEKEYKLIKEDTFSVIVPYGNNLFEREELKNGVITKELMREAAKHSVNVYSEKALIQSGAIRLEYKGEPTKWYMLNSYDERTGLVLNDPENFMIGY